MTTIAEVEGTLQSDGTLVLDQKLDLPPGRVLVTVQSVEQPLDVIEVLRRIHEEQAKRGHVPRSREEIDAEIAAMRQEDEERMQQIEQLHEDCQRAKQPAEGS